MTPSTDRDELGKWTLTRLSTLTLNMSFSSNWRRTQTSSVFTISKRCSNASTYLPSAKSEWRMRPPIGDRRSGGASNSPHRVAAKWCDGCKTRSLFFSDWFINHLGRIRVGHGHIYRPSDRQRKASTSPVETTT